ncbi:MAG: FAD-binding oxidoreductase [Candidatus Nitrosocaldus sp.]|nr:FAD-binding oxidoreductase [Candidatus Nitrosocaldus sp.]MDW8000160.1 FAD-dependent oxidoreductase [Candidatus Nitrosocaldus sp.]
MHKFDVAIAGGGAIGLCTAYELAGRGFRVAVLDGSDARMASSYGNAGYVSPSLGPLSIDAREVEDVARWLARGAGSEVSIARSISRSIHTSMMEADGTRMGMLIRSMALESRDWYARMSGSLGFVYRQLGLIEVYLSRDGLEHRLEHVKPLAYALGIPYRVLARDEVNALESAVRDTCHGAILYPDDAQIEPVTLIRALRDALRGSVVFLGSLERIVWDGYGKGRVESFQTSDARIHADAYILCTGAYRVEGLSLPVVAARGYMVELEGSGYMPRYPVLCGEHRVALSLHGRLRITGMFEPCSIGDPPVEENFARLVEWGGKYITLADARVADRWTGYRPCTPDGLPIIGRVGNCTSNLIVATGHCRLGMTLAPATARLMASLVEGRDGVPDALKPNRYALLREDGPVA